MPGRSGAGLVVGHGAARTPRISVAVSALRSVATLILGCSACGAATVSTEQGSTAGAFERPPKMVGHCDGKIRSGSPCARLSMSITNASRASEASSAPSSNSRSATSRCAMHVLSAVRSIVWPPIPLSSSGQTPGAKPSPGTLVKTAGRASPPDCPRLGLTNSRGACGTPPSNTRRFWFRRIGTLLNRARGRVTIAHAYFPAGCTGSSRPLCCK